MAGCATLGIALAKWLEFEITYELLFRTAGVFFVMAIVIATLTAKYEEAR